MDLIFENVMGVEPGMGAGARVCGAHRRGNASYMYCAPPLVKGRGTCPQGLWVEVGFLLRALTVFAGDIIQFRG